MVVCDSIDNKSHMFQCIGALVKESQVIMQADVENITPACYRALDGSNYDVRCHIAQLLAMLLSQCLKVKLTGMYPSPDEYSYIITGH